MVATYSMLSVFGELGAVHVLAWYHYVILFSLSFSARTVKFGIFLVDTAFMPFYVLFLRTIPSDKGDSVFVSAFQSLYLIRRVAGV